MMKIFIAAVAFFFAGALNAQWDTLNTGTGIKFNCVSFADATIGVVCGLNPSTDSGACGQIYITSNRGDNWFLLPFAAHEKNREIHDAAFTPEVQLWTVRDSGTVVLQHVWSVSYTSVSELSQYSLYCCFAVNDSVFYCAGENGIAFRTFDYGVTWDTMNSETTTNINDIYFADAANGWIVADGGYLAVTADSGSTWTFIPQPQWGFTDFMGFAYQDTVGLNPYIVGEAGAGLFSINGGVNWFGFPTNTVNDIHKIRFINTTGGLMCGDNGYISRTIEGGGWWFDDPSPVAADLFDIAYAGDTTAFICGDSGVVLRSRMDISSVEQPSSPSMAARAFPNPTSGPLFVEVMLSAESNVTVEIVDLLGQVIQTNYYEHVGSGVNRFECSTGDLATGVYFMRVVANEQVVTMPVIRN